MEENKISKNMVKFILSLLWPAGGRDVSIKILFEITLGVHNQIVDSFIPRHPLKKYPPCRWGLVHVKYVTLKWRDNYLRIS